MGPLPKEIPWRIRTQLQAGERPSNLPIIDFLTVFNAVAADSDWRNAHPDQSSSILNDAVHLLRNDTIDRETHGKQTLSYTERHGLITALAQNVLDFSPDQKYRTIDMHLVFHQSTLASQVFYSRAAKNGGKPTELEQMLMDGLGKFTLGITSKTTLENLFKFLELVKKDNGKWTIYPLVEEALIDRLSKENASVLFRIAIEHQLLELLVRALDLLVNDFIAMDQIQFDEAIKEVPIEYQTAIRKGRAIEELKKFFTPEEWSQLQEEKTTDLFSLLMNRTLDRLPETLKTAGGWPGEQTLLDSADVEKRKAIEWVQTFKRYAPLLLDVQSDALHKLDPADIQQVLDCLPANLRAINISKLPWKDLQPIKRFQQLENINATGCKNLQPIGIKNFERLSSLTLTECSSIKNLYLLQNAKNLVHLNIVGCENLSNLEAALRGHPQFNQMKIICDERFRPELMKLIKGGDKSLLSKPVSGQPCVYN